MKIKFIALFCCIMFCFSLFGCTQNNNNKNWYDNIDEPAIVLATEKYLKTQVNYPNTLSIKGYPTIRYGSEQEKSISVVGVFICANGFGVYKDHNFILLLELKENNKLELKYCNIE